MTRSILAGIAMCAAIGAARAETIIGTATVIDGDTIVIAGEHIRLAGIDAPERGQTCWPPRYLKFYVVYYHLPCGEDASRDLRKIVGSAAVVCKSIGHDRYGRTVAPCGTASTPDIGEAMVRSGLAVRYPKYDSECRYCLAEAEARSERRGLWAGEFETPWIWRKVHKEKHR